MNIKLPTLPAEHRLQRLKTWNSVLAALHAVQGIVVLALSSDFALPLTTAFLRFDAQTRGLVPELATWTTVKIGPLVAIFLFLSALAHLTNVLNWRWYRHNLQRHINPTRWIEYSLSATLMLVVIALLVGVYDVASLLLIVFLGAMMNLMGLMMEVHNQTTKRTNWLAFVCGSIAGIGPWVVVAVYLLGADNPPAFVYWIYLSIFLFFNCFAINMVLQYKKVGPWHDYLYGERAYMILSLVAKSLLAWQVFAGTLRPV